MHLGGRKWMIWLKSLKIIRIAWFWLLHKGKFWVWAIKLTLWCCHHLGQEEPRVLSHKGCDLHSPFPQVLSQPDALASLSDLPSQAQILLWTVHTLCPPWRGLGWLCSSPACHANFANLCTLAHCRAGDLSPQWNSHPVEHPERHGTRQLSWLCIGCSHLGSSFGSKFWKRRQASQFLPCWAFTEVLLKWAGPDETSASPRSPQVSRWSHPSWPGRVGCRPTNEQAKQLNGQPQLSEGIGVFNNLFLSVTV